MTALGSSASAILALSLSVVLGLLLGRVRVRGIRLGVAGVLFSSLALAQAGVSFPREALPLVRDCALVIFVYAIGLQVGPGFLASVRAEGLRLNLLSAAVLCIGMGLAAAVVHVIPHATDDSPGLYAGSFTATPALAAGQVVIRQVLTGQPERERLALASNGLAYAITYPFAVIGPVLLLPLLRRLFRVQMDEERSKLAGEKGRKRAYVNLDFEIVESDYVGRTLHELDDAVTKGVVLTRVYHEGVVSVPHSSTVLRPGDVFRAFGTAADVDRVARAMGRPTKLDLGTVPGDLRRAELLVTKAAVLRRSLRDLQFRARTGVIVAHVHRAGIEMVPDGDFTLKFGDSLVVVGPGEGVQIAAREVGNEPSAADRTSLMPIFIGLALGILVGAIPFRLPGLPVPLQIGLVGGPFLVAVALSQLGSVGSIIWYMPPAVNRVIQDLGLCIFLACIGFQSGNDLLQRAAQAGPGLVIAGAALTMIPLFVVACFARWALRVNFITLMGWVAGTMTSTVALAMASDEAGSDAPALAYASVTPLCEILPIVCGEVLALFLR